MRTFVVDLKEAYGTKGGELTAILSSSPFDVADTAATAAWTRPALIVVPGGAYHYVSDREAEPIAQAFLARGFHTFILTYLCAPDNVAYPEQLTELAAAVDYVKKHAEEMNVNKEEVFVVGFSAGGHLAGNLAVSWQDIGEITGKKLDCKPTAVGLSYPVISSKAGHMLSHDNLLQGYTEKERAAAIEKLDLNNAVSENTPPAFLWTTSTDNTVPSENTLLYALELAKRKIPYELHIYPECDHGASTGSFEVNKDSKSSLHRLAKWLDDCAYFFHLFTTEKF